jgi:flavin reductase (DIM6/NTAB) family NADH-FMN oxidoreductase RutF
MQDNVFNSILTGVYVLGAAHQGKVNGTTVTWVTPVSYEPLLVMVALADVRYSHKLVKESGYFGINVLTDDQKEMARHFGLKSGREEDKMEGQNYKTSEQGLPIFDGVKAYIECRVVASHRAGEHTLFIGEVVSADAFNEKAATLPFKQEDYY